MPLKTAALVVLLAALVVAPTADAGSPHVYIDELTASHKIEADGLDVVAVDVADCVGLRRFGVHTSRYGVDKFWRFRCQVIGSDNHSYDVQTAAVGLAGYFAYEKILSVRRMF